MPLKKNIALAFLIIFVSSATFEGCAFKSTTYLPSQAEQKLIKTLQDEFHYQPLVKSVGKTLWIYMPQRRDIFTIKAKDGMAKPPVRKLTIAYLDGDFRNKTFILEYDIVPTTKSPSDNGLATAYTEDFNQEYRNLLGVVAQVYLNTEMPPDFIVIIFADIRNGIEIINTLCFEDLKKYQSSALPYEEYSLRVLSESKGNPKIVNDETGSHIAYGDVPWPDFLLRQIVKRIFFKYQQSDFEPGEDTEHELLTIARETLRIYHFEDFTAVELHDLHQNSRRTIGKDELENLIP